MAFCGLIGEGQEAKVDIGAPPRTDCPRPDVRAARGYRVETPVAALKPTVVFDERGLRIVAVPGPVLPGFDGRELQRSPGRLVVEIFGGRDALGSPRWEPADPSKHRACAIAFNALVRHLKVPAWVDMGEEPFEVVTAAEGCPDCRLLCDSWLRGGAPCGRMPF